MQMKTLVGLATIETGSMPGLREENALAVLANLSVEDEVIVCLKTFKYSTSTSPPNPYAFHSKNVPLHGRGMTKHF